MSASAAAVASGKKTVRGQEIDPFPNRPQWANVLRKISSEPLEFCPDFPGRARRHEAWWNHSVLDRPLFLGAINPNPGRRITQRLDLVCKPDEWFAAKFQDMRQIYWAGDTVPCIRVDFGPAILGAFLGGQLEFSADTAWTHSMIDDDWSNQPNWELQEDNPWWKRSNALLERVAADAPGRYVVCAPDLGGASDMLLNLRGATQLCMDIVECPDVVRAAMTAQYPAWRRAISHIFDVATSRGAGVIHWLGAWSNEPYCIPTCDLNYMLGPREFARVCVPDIARIAATMGRAVFHLDGPGAAPHIDALLEIPELQAIQFTPGVQAPQGLPWVELYRKVLKKGKSMLAVCMPEEVIKLAEELPWEGLCILLDATAPLTTKYVDDIVAGLDRLARVKR
ncbi:MAG TPA: hypothetical protein VIL86_18980 [Tepidisphaeraceae bacterium]|jgi:hypothetical protein